jgi:hypothetical protein
MGYLDSLYPQVPNIDGRDQFERLLRGDVGVIAIGRDAILRRMTDQSRAARWPFVRTAWVKVSPSWKK